MSRKVARFGEGNVPAVSETSPIPAAPPDPPSYGYGSPAAGTTRGDEPEQSASVVEAAEPTEGEGLPAAGEEP